jgi:hypothetical protein
VTTSFPTTLDSFTNPTPADKLGTVAVLHTDQHSNLNDSLEAVEAKTGVDFSSVNTSLDYIANLFCLTQTEHPKGLYRETTFDTYPFVTTVIWYTSSAKTIKLVEKSYTYATSGINKILPLTVVLKIYDATILNVLKRTLTDTVVYDRVFETSRTRTIT